MSPIAERLLSLVPAPGEEIRWEALAEIGLAPLFSGMAATMQNPFYHGEGDVLTHTGMVCEELLRDEGYRGADLFMRQALFLAALLHDVGKIKCTRIEDGQLRSPYHASKGALTARRLLWREFGLCGTYEAQSLREVVCSLIRYHSAVPYMMHHENAEWRLLRIASCGELADGFTLKALCTLERADMRGRYGNDLAASLEKVAYCEMLAEECGCLEAPYRFCDPYSQWGYMRKKTAWRGQPLFRESWGEVILLSGLPGTGKDTWIRKHHPDLPMVSLDEIRQRLHVLPTDKQAPVVAAAQEEARALLRKKQPFIWNATSITGDLRSKQIDLFEQYGASVKTVFLETEWEEELRRNAGRQAVVPVPVIESMLSRLEMPERFECEEVQWEIT